MGIPTTSIKNNLHYFLDGKCLENVRNYKKIKLVSASEFGQKYANRNTYPSYTILNENLVCLELIKEEVKLCKPVYAGMVSSIN